MRKNLKFVRNLVFQREIKNLKVTLLLLFVCLLPNYSLLGIKKFIETLELKYKSLHKTFLLFLHLTTILKEEISSTEDNIFNIGICNIYKVVNLNLYLEINSIDTSGGLFMLYKNVIGKQRYKSFIRSYDRGVVDYAYYKLFFLKYKGFKAGLIRLNALRRDEYALIYKGLYKRIFVWPFLITIKPFIIIIKNIFLKIILY